ncbi:30S ribosomal protein S3 [candidate division WWE3 bacterium RIFCSPLOWO2_01_FULL_39_13]|uniref:Small ribosomal subunit protein uS3 n=1 Tax=candidate division WWE3 bacterium RIFCSPLOWO2_01_FULL_39_13 TaxID=1802624 RepID=A0A1F4V4R4_UNCKA|nr:MAG: 30S ribosomal protein S3 [candidate division WWE3 bacterium RIFCSPLOWO2_01_FULL_39_13]
MSRKVNPFGFRVGVTKDWRSRWYAEGDLYADALIEDDKIRKYLKRELRSAGIESLIIERSIKSVKVIIKVAKPGIVIGRKGVGLSKLREYLSKTTSAELDLQIEEVQKPESQSNIIADSIAMQIERRVSPRRAMNIAADKALEAGVKGIKIQVGGTVYGPNSIAVVQSVARGAVPTQTLRADIDFSKSTASTRGGTIGVKVWVYHGEIGE